MKPAQSPEGDTFMHKSKAPLVISAFLATVSAVFPFSVAVPSHAATPQTSGVYQTAADYRGGRLAFQGNCKSQAHKLELHDVLNKPYIDVIHESERRRYLKSDLFGFRACDGRDFRFDSNLEYQILESRELDLYGRETYVHHGRVTSTVTDYYFSVGPEGKVLGLTLENLKQAFPENHKFHDLLDANFGSGQKLAEYDEFHKMFKVNRLLIASRE
jgi:hypothetical protein